MTPDEITVRPVAYSNTVRPLQREGSSRRQGEPHTPTQTPTPASPPSSEPEELQEEHLIDLRV